MKIPLVIIAMVISGESVLTNNKYILIPNPSICTPHLCWENYDCMWKKCKIGKVPECVQFLIPGASCCQCADFVITIPNMIQEKMRWPHRSTPLMSFIVTLYPAHNSGMTYFFPYYPNITTLPQEE